jgi:PhnB protein
MENTEMEIVPNLHFNGDCEKAIELYKQSFGGRITTLARRKDVNSPDADENPGHIYHAEMMIGSQRIMLDDADEELPGGMNVSILVSMDVQEEVEAAYEKLKDGAKILAPIGETSYSSCFVSLVDRFGVRWELIKENDR